MGVSATPKKTLSRKWRFGTVALVTTAVVVAMVLLLNVVMDTVEKRFPLTVDLTADASVTVVLTAQGASVPCLKSACRLC